MSALQPHIKPAIDCDRQDIRIDWAAAIGCDRLERDRGNNHHNHPCHKTSERTAYQSMPTGRPQTGHHTDKGEPMELLWSLQPECRVSPIWYLFALSMPEKTKMHDDTLK